MKAIETLLGMLHAQLSAWGEHATEIVLPESKFWWLAYEAQAFERRGPRPGDDLQPVQLANGTIVEIVSVASLTLNGPGGPVLVRPDVATCNHAGASCSCGANAWARVATDAALRAECDRRKLISGDLAIVDLVRASDQSIRTEASKRGARMLWDFADDALHAEYERRFGGQPPIEKYRALLGEHDSLKRALSEVDAAIAPFMPTEGVHRADWIASKLREGVALREKGQTAFIAGRDAAERLRLAPRQSRPLSAWSCETGPGIAAKPAKSEPLAFLDENLLADDA